MNMPDVWQVDGKLIRWHYDAQGHRVIDEFEIISISLGPRPTAPHTRPEEPHE